MNIVRITDPLELTLCIATDPPDLLYTQDLCPPSLPPHDQNLDRTLQVSEDIWL